MKLIIFVSIALILSSCGPVYKIGHDLTPPKTKSGLACISGCQLKLQQCNVGCARQFKQCGYEAGLKAKRLFPDLLTEYPQQLEIWLIEKEDYRRELDFYEFRRDLAESHRDLYFANCKKQGKKKNSCRKGYGGHPYSDLDRPYFNNPRPVKPTLEREAARIKKVTCSNNCACEPSYRTCFSSCGGVVKSKKICIKNCPK
jgi:hypothetical protein